MLIICIETMKTIDEEIQKKQKKTKEKQREKVARGTEPIVKG